MATIQKEKDELTFKLLKKDDTIMLSFSDGNVIIADNDGISTYNTNKTVHFKSVDVKVNSTFIECVDEDGIVIWIMPEKHKKSLGLNNDVTVKDKTIRAYRIKEHHYDKIKDLMWELTLKKFDCGDE